jgi:GT2 family glycosyltransferase
VVGLVQLPASGLDDDAVLILGRRRGRKIAIRAAELHERPQDIEALIDQRLAGGDRVSRERLAHALVARAVPALELPEGFTLARRLHRLRDALREPLSDRIIEAEAPQIPFLDTIMAVDERSFWLSGWVRDADQNAKTLVVSPEGQRVELLAEAFRFPRPDVEELVASRQESGHGLVNFLTLAAPSMLDRGWLVEMKTGPGRGIDAPGPEVVRDRTEVLGRILSEFAGDRPDRESLRIRHVRPAVERWQAYGRRLIAIEETRDYGTIPSNPRVSVVVPLYQRVDFVEHQLAQFGLDSSFAEVELVYVLDSPELEHEVFRDAPHLHALHQVPFRVVKLNVNAGFAVANNLAVTQTQAPLLLLLNSDTLPTRAGWLPRMCAFYESTPGIGALGPKLLFEDDSIQHAGMYFELELNSGHWGNRHFFKGFHRDFLEARVSRPVPAVTGACLMISRNVYDEHGGLDEAYVRGGYEDSDLCLRLARAGLRNWYLSEVELYHLEAQSYPSTYRELTTLYNGWLQTQTWGSDMARLMAEQEAPGQSVAPTDLGELTSLTTLD